MKDRAEIRAFVHNLLISKGDSLPFEDQESLLLTGRLQSIDAVDIVVFLEERYTIDFAKIGFDQEQIDSIDAIWALVQSAASN